MLGMKLTCLWYAVNAKSLEHPVGAGEKISA
ncbi:Uncharacterised protein [Vibrio cholerae]|nr:Uncharacterised protein [Vibrio cholerae]